MAYMVERFPITSLDKDVDQDVNSIVTQLGEIRNSVAIVHDWLRHEFGLEKITRVLAEPHKLDVNAFVEAVRGALPKSRKSSAAEIGRLKKEYMDTLAPAAEAATEILSLERKICDLVNAAYGLTREEVELIWRTAPPRMPLDPRDELLRLGE